MRLARRWRGEINIAVNAETSEELSLHQKHALLNGELFYLIAGHVQIMHLERLPPMAIRDDIIAHHVSWAEVHRDAKRLVRQLIDKGPWQGIVALTRGGLIPAAILAREMEIRIVDTLCISTYDKQLKGVLNVLKVPERAVEVEGEGWLLVDDLVDTGTTARKAREILPKSHFATVYAKPKGLPTVDTFVSQVSQDVWVFFPWDTEPQYIAPLVDNKKE